MSRKMPPLTATYSGGGAAGSRLVIRSMCSSPMPPSATQSRTDLCPGSKRRLNPIMNGTPAASTAASARSTCTRSRLTGFSQKIALPACAAAITRSTWVSVLEQMATVSTSSEASSCSMVMTAAPVTDATPSAAAGTASATAATTKPGTSRARSWACIRPIRPQPISPTRRTGSSGPRLDGEPRAASLCRSGHDSSTHSPLWCEATMASSTRALATASSSVATWAASPEIALTKFMASTTFVSS